MTHCYTCCIVQDLAWHSVVWCGVVWCGVVWCGAACHGAGIAVRIAVVMIIVLATDTGLGIDILDHGMVQYRIHMVWHGVMTTRTARSRTPSMQRREAPAAGHTGARRRQQGDYAVLYCTILYYTILYYTVGGPGDAPALPGRRGAPRFPET